MYRIIVQDGSTPLGEFKNFRNLSFSRRLNNYGTCSFEIPIKDQKASDLVALRNYTVYIYRNDFLIWAGEQATREGYLDEVGNNWATITCFDWFEQLFSRYTAQFLRYEGVDAGQIAWDLIDTTQGLGTFGITEGTVQATQNRDRSYENDNIGEIIINLANVINGFDFEINTSRVFNVFTHIGVDRTNLVLEYGRNIQSIRITEDFTNPVNQAIVLGSSGDFQAPIRVEQDDAASQAIYGLRQGLLTEMDTSEQTTLEEKGDSLNRKKSTPLFKTSMVLVPSSNPTIAQFALGDTLTLKVDNGIYNILGTYRVYEWKITVPTIDIEVLDLVLGNFITLPAVS